MSFLNQEVPWDTWKNVLDKINKPRNRDLVARKYRNKRPMDHEEKELDEFPVDGLKLWSTHDGKLFFPVSDTKALLPPGVYEARMTAQGQAFFEKIDFSASGLIRFEDSNIDTVVGEISSFWEKKDLFAEFEFPYKRGILLFGPPGGGKSCAIKLIIQDVIDLGGVAVRFNDADIFIACMRALRSIQPQTQTVVIMEDLESLLNKRDYSLILNMLDGIAGFENVVYLATTNYPEDLESRVKNRPSRFDRRYHIGYPNDKSREVFIKHLLTKCSTKFNSENIDINKWIRDTKEFTFAHIKELVISVVLFGHSYDDAIEILREMKKKITSEDDGRKKGVGFFVDDGRDADANEY